MRISPILVVNAGSSTLKYSLFADGRELARGLIEHRSSLDGADLLARLPQAPAAIGHRVVHGGDRFTAPVRITPDVLARLEELVPLAPLHQPHNLAPMRTFLASRPELPQVACFDTAFHATQDALERRYALPRAYHDRGIKRYGFHGLSYEYIAGRLAEIDPRAAAGRTVVAHLGNGASLCALLAGQSRATTMGFTALDGLVMGTRCGSIDPGVLLHLMTTEPLDARALETLLYRESGLLGVSGVSADLRDLLASPAPEAREAIDLFCYRAARELGSMAAVLQGLDALVFTAGIGEHAPTVRAAIVERAAWLGIELDAEANAANREVISKPTSRVTVRVIPTNEEAMIARHVEQVLAVSSETQPG